MVRVVCPHCDTRFNMSMDKVIHETSPHGKRTRVQKADLAGSSAFRPFTMAEQQAFFHVLSAGSAAMAAFFSQTDSHEGLYYNTSTEC